VVTTADPQLNLRCIQKIVEIDPSKGKQKEEGRPLCSIAGTFDRMSGLGILPIGVNDNSLHM